MWDALAKIVISAMQTGMTGIVVLLLIAWMVDRYFLVRDLRTLNDKMIDAFKDNTTAIATLTTLINQLCQRI